MSEYLKNVIKASGGYAAPEENLESDTKEAPEGYHYMPDGTLMKDSEHAIDEAEFSEDELELSVEDLAIVEELQALDEGFDLEELDIFLSEEMELVPEEADLAKMLLELVDTHGKFNDDNTGVWAGYDSAEKNAENAAIGVKCGNCVFWEAPNGCKIIVAETEEGGLCRFAILPDGAVTATAGSKPAPKKDQIKGSSKNKKGSAASGRGVKFSKKIEESLSKKAKEHNEKAPDGRKTSLRTLKAVYRRGAGAFSTSHRPGQNRNSWAMARVNAFLKLLKSGKPKNAKYTTDNDLLPPSHPRSSKTASAAISASAAEPMSEDTMELAGDPCWKGYKQVGMKNKNGKRVPNCVPSSAAIDHAIESVNSEFGVSRHISKEDAYAVARAAVDKYEYLSDEKLYDAVLWEVQSFAEYATTGDTEDLEELSAYASLLPEGHPATEPSIVASATWLAGASDFDNSSRDAVLTAFSETEDYVLTMHATTRLRAVISSGNLSSTTLYQLKDLVSRYSKVD